MYSVVANEYHIQNAEANGAADALAGETDTASGEKTPAKKGAKPAAAGGKKATWAQLQKALPQAVCESALAEFHCSGACMQRRGCSGTLLLRLRAFLSLFSFSCSAFVQHGWNHES